MNIIWWPYCADSWAANELSRFCLNLANDLAFLPIFHTSQSQAWCSGPFNKEAFAEVEGEYIKGQIILHLIESRIWWHQLSVKSSFLVYIDFSNWNKIRNAQVKLSKMKTRLSNLGSFLFTSDRLWTEPCCSWACLNLSKIKCRPH
jgi:hypothetical protein